MAPGHGEGHNSGQAVNIVAALNVKELMEREKIDGTLLIWPGIAEEQLGSKAFFVRDGVFDGVDVNLFTHVSSNFSMTWGRSKRQRDGFGSVPFPGRDCALGWVALARPLCARRRHAHGPSVGVQARTPPTSAALALHHR